MTSKPPSLSDYLKAWTTLSDYLGDLTLDILRFLQESESLCHGLNLEGTINRYITTDRTLEEKRAFVQGLFVGAYLTVQNQDLADRARADLEREREERRAKFAMLLNPPAVNLRFSDNQEAYFVLSATKGDMTLQVDDDDEARFFIKNMARHATRKFYSQGRPSAFEDPIKALSDCLYTDSLEMIVELEADPQVLEDLVDRQARVTVSLWRDLLLNPIPEYVIIGEEPEEVAYRFMLVEEWPGCEILEFNGVNQLRVLTEEVVHNARRDV